MTNSALKSGENTGYRSTGALALNKSTQINLELIIPIPYISIIQLLVMYSNPWVDLIRARV